VSYRRRAEHSDAKAWKLWVSEHARELERLGLPLAVYQDRDHWVDFLENGSLDRFSDGPPFDFNDLPRGHLEQLCAFLERHYGTKPPLLLQWIRVRLGKDPVD
jgi:hypothetical protein